eukprot:1180637-Prorocentrum_minimum.AAC.3
MVRMRKPLSHSPISPLGNPVMRMVVSTLSGSRMSPTYSSPTTTSSSSGDRWNWMILPDSVTCASRVRRVRRENRPSVVPRPIGTS